MNEITAAIKEAIKVRAEAYAKAQGSHDKPEITIHDYTCGGEDAIGFMLKFVEWIGDNAHYTKYNGAFCWEITLNDEDFEGKEYCTTKELLTKYMEDNKL